MTRAPCPDLAILLPDEGATSAFGAWLARRLGRGDVILLSGPIGAGKTHLARALIRARLGDETTEVPSPTFTLVQTYDAAEAAVWHADLYRLTHPDEVIELGLDAAFDDAIVLVEWPDRLGSRQPPDAISITLATDGEGRIARVAPGGREDLAEALRRDWKARDA